MLPTYEALLEVMISNPLSTLKKLHLDLARKDAVVWLTV